jgi:hypothetical protein
MDAWPSKKRLELDTCLSPNTIDKCIKSLIKKGFDLDEVQAAFEYASDQNPFRVTIDLS